MRVLTVVTLEINGALDWINRVMYSEFPIGTGFQILGVASILARNRMLSLFRWLFTVGTDGVTEHPDHILIRRAINVVMNNSA